ncbi:MAG TPA: class I SAM-dependent methyltransferase [Methylomirabilota bacterium]|jgi:SAM-dependent methyltransferase|nr:class I SAM-dependent methyltransferase [Methylomirabilota bacterium]
MTLAFYAAAADDAFWREHWGAHSTGELLAIAERSPLTRLILDALPARGRVLEAGCGPAQYVVLLRRAGRAALGVDFTVEPLARCRREFPATPVAAMDLRALGLAPASVAAYVSLGVVEHDEAGPDAILSEARRVLEPGGALVLSVPYVNGARRLGTPWIRRRQRRIRERGGQFYQFAFSRAEGRAVLERHGFQVRRVVPYDPARLLRGAWRRLARGLGAGGRGARTDAAMGAARSAATGDGTRDAAPRAAVKRALYSRPALALLGHMILFVAVKR